MVRVSHYDLSFGSHVDHRKVFEQFATDGSSSNDKSFQLFYLLHTLSSDYNFQISKIFFFLDAKLLKFISFFRYFLNQFIEMECPKLLYWHVLICDGLDNLLRNYSSEICTNCWQFGLSNIAEFIGKFQYVFDLLLAFLQFGDHFLNHVHEHLAFFY